MEIINKLEAMTAYPSEPASAPDGKYAIHTAKRKQVKGLGSDINYSTWFRTPSFDVTTIQRLQSVQVFTKSNDQGYCDNEAAGTWTWFELAIMENADAKVPKTKDDIQLSWTSHKNVLNCDTYTWLEGPLFPQEHDMFRLVEKNNVIAVRLCARFPGWVLNTQRGYLVVELGPSVKRKSLNFGWIAARVKSVQEAFDDVNKSAFPDLEQLPSLPESLFQAEMLNTATANDPPLHVLSLDGGGVHGLASLMILKKIMDMSCPGKKPCEVFDLIGGTSTGGLIAIMLGRLEMTVEDCIASYMRFMSEIFPPNIKTQRIPNGLRTLWNVAVNGEKWDSSVLEKVIKQLVEEQLKQNPDKVLLRDDVNPNLSCKVFVTAVATSGANDHAPVLLRSYVNPLQMPDLPEIKLWEAARATSAAPLYFAPMEINKQTFVDGGLQANNPLGWLWNEVLQVFGPLRNTSCFLSIGTGTPQSETLPTVMNPIGFTKALTGILTNTDIINILFRSLINSFAPRGMSKKYWRFNVGDGLPNWVEEGGVWKWKLLAERQETDIGAMDDVNGIELTKMRVEEYMKQPGFELLLNECKNALNSVDKFNSPKKL